MQKVLNYCNDKKISNKYQAYTLLGVIFKYYFDL